MGFKDERLNFASEPGIVRNFLGRIIETGWPTIPTAKWPLAYQELQKGVASQTAFERHLIDGTLPEGYISQDLWGNFHTSNGGRFFLGGDDLLDTARTYLQSRMIHLPEKAAIHVCDLGGGNGFLLERTVINWKNPHSPGYALRDRLNTTLTTLVNFDPDLLASRRYDIDQLLVGTAIELPPDNLFANFDLVLAQNSVFFYSIFPELATLNLRKMLRPGGVIFATLPLKPFLNELAGFDLREYLRRQSLFRYQELERKGDGLLIRLDPVN